jgi:ComF family protein
MENLVYHWLRAIRRKVLAPTCIACGGSAIDGDLCAGCKGDLRFNTRFCLRCAIPLAEESATCGACLRLPPRYQYSYCAFEYGYPIAEFVRKLKYGHSLSQAKVLGELLSDYLHRHHHNAWPHCIVPVPLSTQRYHERGFNQAIELGRVLEKTLKVSLRTDLLERTRHTVEQAGLTRRERRKNLRNAFAIATSQIPDHVAILDDVVTTGSTVNEIARMFKRAGVSTIEVWAVARAPLH